MVLPIPGTVMRSKLIGSGIRNLERLHKKNDDFIHSTCQTIRKHTGPAETREISMVLEETLQHLVKWCRYRYLIQRDLDYVEATLDTIESTSEWIDQYKEDKEDEPTGVEKFNDDEVNQRDWVESIEGHLEQTISVSGVPMAYVIRPETALATVDPGPGLPSLDEELLARGRHEGHYWPIDNRKLWFILRKACQGTEAWSLIAPYDKTKNGRMAFRAIKNQYMGEDSRHLLMQEAGKIIQNSFFDGKSKDNTYHHHCGSYRRAMVDLGTGNQMSNEMSVVKFMDGWQVDGLMHLASIVFSTDKYKYDLEETMTFLATNLRTLKTKNKPKSKISSVTKKRKKEGSSSPGFDPSNPGRFAPKKLWKEWTDEEKAAQREAWMEAWQEANLESDKDSDGHSVEEQSEDQGTEAESENPDRNDAKLDAKLEQESNKKKKKSRRNVDSFQRTQRHSVGEQFSDSELESDAS